MYKVTIEVDPSGDGRYQHVNVDGTVEHTAQAVERLCGDSVEPWVPLLYKDAVIVVRVHVAGVGGAIADALAVRLRPLIGLGVHVEGYMKERQVQPIEEPGPGPQAATYRVPGKQRVISADERQGGEYQWVSHASANVMGIKGQAVRLEGFPLVNPGFDLYPAEVVRAAMNSTKPQPLPMPPELQAQLPHVVKVIDRDAGVVFHGRGKIEHTGQPQAAAPFLAGKTDQEVLQGAQQWLNVLRAQLPDTEATRWARTIEQVLLHHQALLKDTRKGADPPRFTHQALPVYTADQVAAAIDTAMSRPTELWREAGMVRPDLLEVIKGDVLAALSGTQREAPRQRLVHYYHKCGGEWGDGDGLVPACTGGIDPDNLCPACRAIRQQQQHHPR